MFWLLKRFHLTVLHIPGKKQVWADALSRRGHLFLRHLPLWAAVWSSSRQELRDLGQPPRV